MEIPTAKCRAPPPERLLRRIDNNFVKCLLEQIKRDPTAPGVPPLALLCTDISCCEDFIPHLSEQYTYEVIGGLHTVTARKQLLLDNPGKIHFHIRTYCIYYSNCFTMYITYVCTYVI